MILTKGELLPLSKKGNIIFRAIKKLKEGICISHWLPFPELSTRIKKKEKMNLEDKDSKIWDKRRLSKLAMINSKQLLSVKEKASPNIIRRSLNKFDIYIYKKPWQRSIFFIFLKLWEYYFYLVGTIKRGHMVKFLQVFHFFLFILKCVPTHIPPNIHIGLLKSNVCFNFKSISQNRFFFLSYKQIIKKLRKNL